MEIPAEKYTVQILSPEQADSSPRNLGDLDDRCLEALLNWVKEYYVHKTAGMTALCFEQDVYFIHEHFLKKSPEWEARIVVYSIWEEENQTILFKLARK